jgi:hypothetical protein
MWGIPIELVAGFGIFLGCFGRAMLPFFRKKAECVKAGDHVGCKWQRRYLWTIIFAVFVSFIATMMILPSFQIPPQYLFPNAFFHGWAAQDIINKVAK